MKYKILTVVGTRPEIIRMSEIIKSFDKNFKHLLVHTNQNFDENLKDVFFKELSLKKPDYDLKVKEKTASKSIASIIFKIEDVILKEKPDAFFILGDTNSCLSAIVARKYQIPIFHYEAGNRCFDQRVPEETNRSLIDHISDINLTYSDFASKNLIREGLPADRIIKVGSPLKEVFLKNKKKINRSSILKNLKLKNKKYILASYHREENVDNTSKLKIFVSTLEKISNNLNIPIIVSTHPRTRKKLNLLTFKKNKKISFLDPFSYFDYMKLQIHSKLVISDSGSISEEASILGFNAISLRDTLERQEAMENATVIMSNLNQKNIENAVKISLTNNFKIITYKDYDNIKVSSKISRIVTSYIEYVNREVWKKNTKF
jgi:UDP-N-acetylglucosamine 2-epimerase